MTPNAEMPPFLNWHQKRPFNPVSDDYPSKYTARASNPRAKERMRFYPGHGPPVVGVFFARAPAGQAFRRSTPDRLLHVIRNPGAATAACGRSRRLACPRPLRRLRLMVLDHASVDRDAKSGRRTPSPTLQNPFDRQASTGPAHQAPRRAAVHHRGPNRTPVDRTPNPRRILDFESIEFRSDTAFSAKVMQAHCALSPTAARAVANRLQESLS